MRHPTRYDLDQASIEHPILISHSSGHIAVANTKALKMAGIFVQNPEQPAGGVIRVDENGWPTGVLEEEPAVGLVRPPMTVEQIMSGVAYGAQLYAAQGVTTGNIGNASVGWIQLFMGAAQAGLLPIRVNLWPGLESADTAYGMDLGSDLLSLAA